MAVDFRKLGDTTSKGNICLAGCVKLALAYARRGAKTPAANLSAPNRVLGNEPTIRTTGVPPPRVRFFVGAYVQILFNDGDLTLLIEAVVAATLDRLEAAREKATSKLAYTEPEAAALLSIRPHVLRDARLRGEIRGARVGKRILYERDELFAFLRRRGST